MTYQPYELATWYHKVIMYFKKSIFEYSFKHNTLICNEYKIAGDTKYVIDQEKLKVGDNCA